jgi:3-oxoacyl-[acyl-carrier protein] reductase
MDNLSGRTALVTGGTRGIGRAIALALAEAGAEVIVNYREHAPANLPFRAIQADVSMAVQVERMVQTIGAIDILVNNAGIARPQAIEDVTERDGNELIAVNLTSCFLVTQAALPGMRVHRWGRIINISSVAAQVGGIVGPHYAASKAGMLGLTRYYAAHLAGDGITANAIAPALIATDMAAANPKASPARIPAGRFGNVEEVASAAVLLARNGYITGQTLHVNGGWYMT